ncbi:MAG: hypothetical protein HY363_06455 [Candidatus Aenigmarchaeota archaeon]|nr:hypothetical protein [Candidatus Aenigmarchaeota archaeon]
MAETKTRKLERIFWDSFTNRFCNENGSKFVKTIIPVGKMHSAVVNQLTGSIENVVNAFAEDYEKFHPDSPPNAYELIRVTHSGDGYLVGKDVYAYRFYRIS